MERTFLLMSMVDEKTWLKSFLSRSSCLWAMTNSRCESSISDNNEGHQRKLEQQWRGNQHGKLPEGLTMFLSSISPNIVHIMHPVLYALPSIWIEKKITSCRGDIIIPGRNCMRYLKQQPGVSLWIRQYSKAMDHGICHATKRIKAIIQVLSSTS